MNRSLLALDIGNSHTVGGIFRDRALVSRIRFRTDPGATADEYRVALAQLIRGAEGLSDVPGGKRLGDARLRFARAVVASVVPTLDHALREALAPVPVTFVTSETHREFALELPDPSQLGADRLANAAGALALGRGPYLIVDAGTATTFCALDSRPAYIGGAIAPGLDISWRALLSRAAKLYSVELREPRSALGNTTESQLQSGVLIGYRMLIEGMVERLRIDAGPSFARAETLVTGGCAHWLSFPESYRRVPDLTLIGLHRYAELTE